MKLLGANDGLLVVILLLLCGCAESAVPAVSSAVPSASNASTQSTIVSGLNKGEDIIPWNPIHIAGPNKGTNACPVCTYEARPAIIIFTKAATANETTAWELASQLQALVNQQQGMQLKGFVIALDSTPEHLRQMADAQKIATIGLCYPDPQTREHDLKVYRINPSAINTVMIYSNYKIVANFVNLKPADFDQVKSVVAGLH